jgi:hypothetical protein
MLRYLGQVYGAYPTDPVSQYECDYLTDNYAELFDKLTGMKFKSGDEQAQIIEQNFSTHIPKLLT